MRRGDNGGGGMKVGAPGVKVLSRGGSKEGVTTGGAHMCRLEGCRGMRIAVRWPGGRMTYPCTKGMSQRGARWAIE